MLLTLSLRNQQQKLLNDKDKHSEAAAQVSGQIQDVCTKYRAKRLRSEPDDPLALVQA